MATDARPGAVVWLGLRSARLEPMTVVDRIDLTADGADGDHGRAGRRAVTLFQAEHLAAVAAFLGRDRVEPEVLRRNIHVAGLNLGALRGVPLAIGTGVVEITGPCVPCSRMETALGPGGYNALRGHGGWCARVISAGKVEVGCRVLRA